MFGNFKRRMFAAKIMAEIKAQHGDQDFVSRLFSVAGVTEDLEALRTQGYYKDDAAAPFLAACHILELGLRDTALNVNTRITCLRLIVDRLRKARTNPQFWLRHSNIFGGLSDAVDEFADELVPQ